MAKASKGLWAVCFDTETTGLVKPRSIQIDKQPEIIEFYGCLVNLNNGKIDKELDLLIQPSKYPMTELVMKDCKTKLSNELLADACRFKEVSETIRDFLENAPLLIAHNLSFDKDMVEVELERLRQKIKWPKRGICTVEQTNHLQGKRLSLTKLHELLFNEGFEDAHRARYDVMALVRCAVELAKRGLIA